MLLAIVIGVAVGIGAYTVVYAKGAKGASYLTNDPAACMNSHVMREQFDGWIASSHRAAAVCNDCHTPPGLVSTYADQDAGAGRLQRHADPAAPPEPGRRFGWAGHPGDVSGGRGGTRGARRGCGGRCARGGRGHLGNHTGSRWAVFDYLGVAASPGGGYVAWGADPEGRVDTMAAPLRWDEGKDA